MHHNQPETAKNDNYALRQQEEYLECILQDFGKNSPMNQL